MGSGAVLIPIRIPRTAKCWDSDVPVSHTDDAWKRKLPFPRIGMFNWGSVHSGSHPTEAGTYHTVDVVLTAGLAARYT
jgi:hypothetical protein